MAGSATPVPADKSWLRRMALQRRKERSTADLVQARREIGQRLRETTAGASVVCSYLPTATEPMDPTLADALTAGGARVLLPVTSERGPLDWAEHQMGGTSAVSSLGIAEPVGRRLGPAAIIDADFVLIPALLVDVRGIRLGRGGGFYDRSLSMAGGRVLAVVFADEVVPRLPTDPWDLPADGWVTPAGLTWAR